MRLSSDYTVTRCTVSFTVSHTVMVDIVCNHVCRSTADRLYNLAHMLNLRTAAHVLVAVPVVLLAPCTHPNQLTSHVPQSCDMCIPVADILIAVCGACLKNRTAAQGLILLACVSR